MDLTPDEQARKDMVDVINPAVAAMGDGGGAIVHIASIEGTQPARGHTHYAVSKAALLMHAKAAALELGPRVRVNAVSPGLIDSTSSSATSATSIGTPPGTRRSLRSTTR